MNGSDHYNMDTGKMQNLLDPQPGDFEYDSMVRSLSRERRYSGDCDQNVAQHLILSKEIAKSLGYSANEQMLTLLHDIEESLLGDKPSPKKAMQDEAHREGINEFYSELADQHPCLPEQPPEEIMEKIPSFDEQVKEKEADIKEAQYEMLSREFEDFNLEPPSKDEKQKIKTVDRMAACIEPFIYGVSRSGDALRNGHYPVKNHKAVMEKMGELDESKNDSSPWTEHMPEIEPSKKGAVEFAEKGFPLYLYYDSDESARAFDRHFRDLIDELAS